MWPGTEWEQIKDVFLLQAGNTYAAGSTGGEATHALTINEMPSHCHYSDRTSQTSFSSGGPCAARDTSGTQNHATSYTGGLSSA